MASLKVISDRCTDNALTVTIRIPPRRDGTPNLGCLTRIMSDAHSTSPDAYDPPEVHHAAEAPMPASFDELLVRAESDDPHVGSLKAGEAVA